MLVQFKIPIAPVSKKNSLRMALVKGRYIPLPSKSYVDYERQAGWFIPKLSKPIEEPITVKCLFYMPTHRRCDLVNMLEAIDDVMVKHRLIADDNYNIIVSHDGSRVLYDKQKPRTEVYIERLEDESEDIPDICELKLRECGIDTSELIGGQRDENL